MVLGLGKQPQVEEKYLITGEKRVESLSQSKIRHVIKR